MARFVESLGRCRHGPGGAWVIEALELYVDDFGEEQPVWALSGTVRLVHLNDAGVRTESDRGFVAELGIPPDDGNEATIAILDTHDYDGDGVDEVVIEVRRGGYDLDSHEHAILGAMFDSDEWHIGPLEMFDDIPFNTVEDYDGDGVYDVVTERMYWLVQRCFDMGGTPPEGTPPVLLHATADGQLSATDAVAEAYLKAQCPNPPEQLLVGGNMDWEIESMRRIACARLWGHSAARVIARISREWPRLDASDLHGEESCRVPREAFETFALIDPPLVFAR